MLSGSFSRRIRALLRRHADACLIALLLFPAIILRLPQITRPLHGDELNTFVLFVLERSFGGIISGSFAANNHLLNSLIMKTVYLWVGEIPALLRLPNLVFGLAAIAVLYLIGTRELGRVFAFVAALIFSLHPASMLYFVWGRGYAGMVLFSLLSAYFFLGCLRSPAWYKSLLLAATGFLAVSSHLFAVNVIIAQGLTVLWLAVVPQKGSAERFSSRMERMGPIMLWLLGALAAVFATYLPVMMLAESGVGYSFQSAFPLAMMNYLAGFRYSTEVDLLSCSLMAGALIGIFSLRGNRELRGFLVILFLAPVSLYILSRFISFYTLHPRFFVYLLPFYCFLFAAGLKQLDRTLRQRSWCRGRRTWVLGCAHLLVISLIIVGFSQRTKIPHTSRLLRPRQLLDRFIADHPGASFLTNNSQHVRVQLRQEERMARVSKLGSQQAIRRFVAASPGEEIFYIHVHQKRYSPANLIHYSQTMPPEELYREDRELRQFLMESASLELDLARTVQIYAFDTGPARTDSPNAD